MQTGATTMSDRREQSSVQYRQLLDVVHANLSGPYEQCQFKENGKTVPVTTDPGLLQTLLQDGKFLDIRHHAVTSYSPRCRPSLTELSDMLEAHPLGREDWNGGAVTANFIDALRKLDSFGDSRQYTLVEKKEYKEGDTVGQLTLVRGTIGGISIHPALQILRQWQRPDGTQSDADYSCDLVVQLSPSDIIDIGPNYIVPFFYGNKSFHGPGIERRRPIEFVGKRINDRNRDFVAINDHVWPDLRLHTDQRKILEVIGQQLNGHMYKAVRQMVREAAKETR